MEDERPTNLPVMRCCATCEHFRGWLDNAWCARWEIKVLPYTKCDTGYERRADMPMWILVERIEDA